MKIVHMIGNAHLDPVWLWPWEAGVDETLATFRSAADRCEEYPEFVYTRGESWLYQQVEKLDPALFKRVKDLVRRGQWHITGGQYVQPDCNGPTLEGWRRQFLHGRRYFKEKFNVLPTVGYNVDSFGHPASLPDILCQAGCDAYVFQRPPPADLKLPGKTFRWRGANGGEVIAFRMYPCYVTRSDDLYGQIQLALEHADPQLGHTMCFYGVGNHGGGPTKANIEYIRDNRHAFEGAELRFSTPEAFFQAVEKEKKALPVYEGEIQYVFPGCYGVMHDIKQEQHHGERLLDQAERAIELFTKDAKQKEDQTARLDRAWEDLLFTQFHDILAGTSAPRTWRSVRAMQGRARITGEELLVETTRRWARNTLPPVNHQQIAAINPAETEFDDWLECEPHIDFDRWGDRWISDREGRPVPYQRIQPDGNIGFLNRVLFRAEVPAGGCAQYLVRDDKPPRRSPSIRSDLQVSRRHLENRHVSLSFSGNGISGLRFGRAKTPLLGSGGIGLHLREDNSDTWTFFQTKFTEPVRERMRGAKWRVGEQGPLRATVFTEGFLGGSRVRWTVSLYRNDPRVFLAIEVVFTERYRMLQLPVSLVTEPGGWIDGIPGGSVDRGSEATEFPVQGWSLTRAGRNALAVLTPDAYSLSHQRKLWQWTLLRSPKMAWGRGQVMDPHSGRDDHTDQGFHTFQFVLWPARQHDPDLLDRAARRMAQPPVIFDRYEGMNRPPWGDATPPHLWTENEHRAVKDGRRPHLATEASGNKPRV